MPTSNHPHHYHHLLFTQHQIGQAMATEEEFSFPTPTDTPPRFIESPRLWRTTSLVSAPESPITREDPQDFNFLYYASNKKPAKSKYLHQRKSFSHVECGMIKTRDEDGYNHGIDGDDDDDQEDKMDMLWEDFNEEFSRNSKSSSRADNSDHHLHRVSSGKMLNIGCVQALKLSRSNKKPSIVEFMKVLKKMFLIQNSHRSIKRTQ
ncbi:hypothetical protein ACH5RR_033829 [Cinchona calisaya]|uniref:Uncharacterized protein n=1 Tax=Cinchona calisaya TaxID=153742 RepID=A0ABD2YEJ8_9GENT